MDGLRPTDDPSRGRGVNATQPTKRTHDVRAQVTTTPAKQALPARPPGRPYGSTNKVNGRKVLFGKQDKGQWHQGKYELQPGVSMVCLAAVDKETGHAQRGVITFSRHRLVT